MFSVLRDIPQLKADFFKALGHPIRIRILEQLVDGEQSVAALLQSIGTEQSHLSQQLGILRRAGLVTSRRDGSTVVYAIADDRIEQSLAVAKSFLLDMLTATRDELKAS